LADIYGHVNQLVTTSPASIYTCPEPESESFGTITGVSPRVQDSNVQSKIISIIMCNYSTTVTYTIQITPDTSAPTANEEYLFYQEPIASGTTQIVSPGSVMFPGSTLWVSAGANTKITCTVNYIEVM